MSNPLPSIGPREAMERLNFEAAKFPVWLPAFLRTRSFSLD